MSTRSGDSRPGSLVRPAPAIAGPHRASARGAVTPDAQMPPWATQSGATRIVYQILRNGLPAHMTAHERPLLELNLIEMLRGELPAHVRTAARRTLAQLGVAPENMPHRPPRRAR